MIARAAMAAFSISFVTVIASSQSGARRFQAELCDCIPKFGIMLGPKGVKVENLTKDENVYRCNPFQVVRNRNIVFFGLYKMALTRENVSVTRDSFCGSFNKNCIMLNTYITSNFQGWCRSDILNSHVDRSYYFTLVKREGYVSAFNTYIGSQLSSSGFIRAFYKLPSRQPQSKGSKEQENGEYGNDTVGNFELIAPDRRESLGSLLAAILCLALAFPVAAWGADRWDDHKRFRALAAFGSVAFLGISSILGPLVGLDLYNLWLKLF